MEVSTIPLNMLKYKFSRPAYSVVNTIIFVVTFFFSRMVVFPWIWSRWVWTFYQENIKGGAKTCYPSYFFHVVVIVGLVFHGLNIYWMILVIKGAVKKIRGPSEATEKPKAA